jgi:hypothetical protein
MCTSFIGERILSIFKMAAGVALNFADGIFNYAKLPIAIDYVNFNFDHLVGLHFMKGRISQLPEGKVYDPDSFDMRYRAAKHVIRLAAFRRKCSMEYVSPCFMSLFDSVA